MSSKPSIFKRSLAAVFCAAAAMAVPVTPALADGVYMGTITTVPPSQARVDAPLTIKPSETNLSRRLETLQRRFGDLMPEVKIIVMDKDWFQQNNILNGVDSYQYRMNEAQGAAVRGLTSEFIAERGHILFHPDALRGVQDDVAQTEGMALKFDYGTTEEEAQNGAKSMCLLFPHFADLDRDGYYQTLLQRNESIHGDIARAPLREPMDYEFMKRFVDYHEIGHCYDRWYIKATGGAQTPQEFLHARHKAEVYGEVFANLMLARDGYTNFSEKQADMRLAVAALSGPISARVNDPRDVSFYMTYAYLLHQGSRNAGHEIERLGTEGVRALSMEEVVNLAHEITERSIFDIEDVPSTIGFMMGMRYDLSELEAAAQSSPVAQRRLEIAQRLKADMEGAVRRALDLGNRTEPVLQPSSFNFSNPSFPYPPRSEQESRAADMGRALLERVGPQATQDELVRAYAQQKNQLRGAFDLGSASQRAQSAYDLTLIQMALKNAHDILWPPPPPAPEAPVTPPPAAPLTAPVPAPAPVSYRMEWQPLVLKPAA